MSELVPGGNTPLPGGTLTLRVPGPFDVSALVTDDGGKVGGDADFVFYNQPSAPGARLHGDTLTVDPSALRPGATRVTVVVSPADPGAALGGLPAPTLHVNGPGGRPLARFTPPRPQRETVLLLAELYRRGAGWKLRALGQGYADGLAGLARDFGVDVTDDASPAQPPSGFTAPPSTAGVRLRAPARLSGAASRLSSAASRWSRPTGGPSSADAGGSAPPAGASPGSVYPAAGTPGSLAPADGFLGLVNSARAAAGSPPVSLDGRLGAAARAHAADMASAGRLGTESRDGTSVHQRVTDTGYTYLTVGEHLVSGPRTPEEFVEYCLRTEQARRTLRDPAFTQVGVAHVTGSRTGDTYWTALWARPLMPGDLARTAAEVTDLTNRERARAGLAPLATDALLTRAAQAHSTDMVVRAFYSHTGPDGSRPWDRAAAAGSTRRTIGENIACGQRSPAEVVEGWMNSPGHRANILKREFTHIGIGFAGGGKAGTYWTQLFGA
ncbi:CAP domain-containing protein [Streptomyces sp. WI04-05B]|uniref:CAP domain-containing protein n=1 Tax=Streptomyces TaxID=1883 RepID=UPI0029B4E23F|nr:MULTISPECIES: CAP domain-containing protein [unclassified Streptomyces]MDX2545841.1 CAP domain-containing protein [Streptomyces sp. WI04-05B]MDX2586400.1 CAP domain-containing protein [Streptomyces sp. WI04-05A]MDX3747094.1 CAP domain-containing protein [Streptomyces sp. AK08-02]